MSSSIKPSVDTSAREGLWTRVLMIAAGSVFGRRRIREVIPEVIPPDEAEWWPSSPEPEAEMRSAARAEEVTEEEEEAAARAEADATARAEAEAGAEPEARAEAENAAEAREAPADPQERLEHRPAPVSERADPIPAPPQAAERAANEDDSSAVPEIEEPVELNCDISFWRGYRRAAFYARIVEDGEELAVAESSPFRPAGNGLPERTEAAQQAYDELCAQLEREGWTLVSQGSTWFDATYRRELTGLAEPAPE